MSRKVKTNAMRELEKAGIEYTVLEYDASHGFVSGVEAARVTETDETLVYKTLVTEGADKNNYVCVIPVAQELDLKKAAKAFSVKKLEMIHAKDITKVTGYIKGGCSPVGMKKLFNTIIDESASDKSMIYVSGGKPGVSAGVDPQKLSRLISASFADVIVKAPE